MAARIGRDQRGITLVEVVAVAAIVSILVGLSVPSFEGMRQVRLLEARSDELLTDLRYVRSEAIARNETVWMRFASAMDGTCYVIHIGSGACSCSPVGTTCTADAQELKSVVLPAENKVGLTSNVGAMAFAPTYGTTTPTGTLTLSDRSGHSLRHVISILGRARRCAIGGLNGFPAC
jgi:type IV fimbrial biogenesis protein FimT